MLTHISIADKNDSSVTFQYRVMPSADQTHLHLICDEQIPQEVAPPVKYNLSGIPRKVGHLRERRLCQSKITLLPKNGIFILKNIHQKVPTKRKGSLIYIITITQFWGNLTGGL